MTWGTQNSAKEAFEQIDFAFDCGVNFIDTAELYPTTPLSADTQGDTESIIGQWLKQSGKRDSVIIATKVAGKGPKWIDDGKPIDGAKIRKSLEGSLTRLQTDYIDLYQLHWPNRNSYHFRQHWTYNPKKQDRAHTRANILDMLQTLDDLVKEGKIRHIGLSNESCWGTCQFLQIAEEHRLPRIVSVQNEYNLMCRLYDLDMAEMTQNEKVGLLAFSPLGAGMLSGKYQEDAIPTGSRRSMQPDLSGRFTDFSKPALTRYIELAEAHKLAPAQLALAFCLNRPFMTSVIIGATTMAQLETNLGAAKVELSEEIVAAIAEIYREHPLPM